MSTKAHIVLSFGSTHVELYRHWGGAPPVTGLALIEAMRAAPQLRERQHFHEGGYLLRSLLVESDGQLPQYQVIDGTIGWDWEYGYYLQYLPFEVTNEQPSVYQGIQISDGAPQGEWRIFYSELEGHETLDEWLPNAKQYSFAEFEIEITRATNEAIQRGVEFDLDVRDAFLRQFKGIKGGDNGNSP